MSYVIDLLSASWILAWRLVALVLLGLMFVGLALLGLGCMAFDRYCDWVGRELRKGAL